MASVLGFYERLLNYYLHMKYSAVIEIPKGSDRRIHMSYDNSGFIDL